MADARRDASQDELSWDEAARGYDAYFSPRFAPYLGAALGALLGRASALPKPGCIVVPCVGPGRELIPLARALPERRIEASDLSGEMVELARQRTQRLPNVSVERHDATALPRPASPAAALFSAFGLQRLPNPGKALSSWLELLEPGGLAAVLFWPSENDRGGPFDIMHRLLAETSTVDRAWEGTLAASARAASARIQEDLLIAFEMQHDDAGSLWHALTRLGPLRGLATARGQDFVTRLGARFEAELPAGPLSHTPEARLLLIERD
jgi:trans-aconitate methyltransferase